MYFEPEEEIYYHLTNLEYLTYRLLEDQYQWDSINESWIYLSEGTKNETKI